MVDMRLEVDVIPVSDVDRSKQFYGRLGWRLDDDVARETAFASSSSRPGLWVLSHVRQGNNRSRAGFGRWRAGCLRHRSGPSRSGRAWC